MNKKIVQFVAVLVGVLVCTGLFLNMGNGEGDFTVRVSGNDGRPAGGAAVEGPIKIEGALVKGEGVASDIKGNWPWFRGEDFTNVTYTDADLLTDWSGGLETLWTVDVGEGYAGAAVYEGKVYLIDYDQEKREDAIRCLSLDDGREIWRYSYQVKISRNHGMSRTVPAVTDKYVVTIGPKCHVTCLDAETGEFKWMINLVAEYGTEVPLWYAGQCPFIEDGKAIIAPGGDAMIMAVDCETGDVVWETPNPDGWVMTHVSAVPMDFAGKRMYVWEGGGKYEGGAIGVDAGTGEVLWKYTDWKMMTNVPSPVVVGDDKILLTAGYDEGGMMLQLVENNGQIEAESLYRFGPEVFGSEQHTPIYYNGYIYGIRPDWQLVCMDVDGNIVWASEKKFYRLGPWAIINDYIYAMDEEGRITLARAWPNNYEELAETVALEGHESWGPIAYVDGRIIIRNLKKMACVGIRQ